MRRSPHRIAPALVTILFTGSCGFATKTEAAETSRTNATAVPTLRVRRDGFYRAFYLQDTWNATRKLTLNYGMRGDWYKQSQNTGQAPVELKTLSPRFNLAYALTPRTIARLSYDHLFQQPPLAQGGGSVLGMTRRTCLPSHSSASPRASIEPRPSPSGRTWVVSRKR